ncbi:50S ribosomal protein L31 [Malacoplasma iowae]|uniref:50S ribosomal protein L31 n=2 Tax=Malacoplasma iowae TaxID=2116 RepID=A0A084U3A0_MALIO|nr:50S ribosomal protein L31 [Malacoplasma iowae]KFB07436.1 ribosomal protein L31 [Malacoplasma iowae DK-CPA]VEU62663.1 50S ribosomal protein L31 [Mycoplasmopsis fermentans]EGZ31078.1 50S ribosomal protein L31 [Malacoplasma iowae 695]QHG89688.1 50S ribosomal protein L31 [Malacoplasma iowae 695]VEU72183.1 50S ribosomal protein L31 [Malacoplasma iowae]
MKKDIHTKSQFVTFTCASCSSKFEIKSTLKDKEVTIDICSSCHPFYSGTSTGQQIKGRAEQFSKKIVTQPTKKVEKKNEPKKQNKKIVKSLGNI